MHLFPAARLASAACPFPPSARTRTVLCALRPIPELSPANLLAQPTHPAQDLHFLARTHTIRNRNRPAKQVGGQYWLNLHSLNRGSTRQSVLCAVSASPECLMNRGELHRLRTGSPVHHSRPSGSAFFFHVLSAFLPLVSPNSDTVCWLYSIFTSADYRNFELRGLFLGNVPPCTLSQSQQVK
jgi:hypothetical protein